MDGVIKLGSWFRDRVWHEWLGRPYALNYSASGDGDEPLLLLHGLASSHQIWRTLVAQLRQDYSIIAPDLLGFGESPAPEWPTYDVATHARHVQALLRRFAVQGPITIVGHSMGCLVAVHLAHTNPGLVKRLVLFEPPLFADEPSGVIHDRMRERYYAAFRYVASHPQLLFTARGEFRTQLARISGLSMSQETWIPFQRSLENTIMVQKVFDELHDITVRTDIIHGRLDFVAPKGRAERKLGKNTHITFHMRTRTHGVSARAARDIAELLRS